MNIRPHKGGLKLSLTKDDFEWEYFTAGGHGGQNVQKTATAVRCVHKPSGASGIARDERSQIQNKRSAFKRCCKSAPFTFWAKMEMALAEERLCGRESIEVQIERDMQPANIITEIWRGGKWQSAQL